MLFPKIKMSHNELIVRGKKWLFSRSGGKCKFVLKEMMALGNAEIPDLIGFNYYHSILVECKTSRSDFHADKKKAVRNGQRVGVGERKYFLCEKEIIFSSDLPEHWGLLWIYGKRIKVIERSTERKFNYHPEIENGKRLSHERDMMISALNRFQIRLGPDFEMINDMDWNPTPLWSMKHEMKTNYQGPI